MSTTALLRAPMVPLARRLRAYFAPVARETETPAIFDPAAQAGFNLDSASAPEYLSALENSPAPVDPGRDKLVRFIYKAISGDRKLKNALTTEDQIEKWLTSIQGAVLRRKSRLRS